MGLRCSVLGHDYGESEVRQEREERGSEVLVTVREVETCARCGGERVTSENKEVTSITDPPDRPAPEPDTPDRSDTDAETPTEPETAASSPEQTTADGPTEADAETLAEEDAEIIDADGPTDAAGPTEAVAEAGGDIETDDVADADEDEAEAGDDDASGDGPAVPVREAESSAQTTLGDATATEDSTTAAEPPESSDPPAAESADSEPGVAVDDGPEGLDHEAGDWPEGPDRADHEYDADRGRWPEPDDVSHPVHGEGDADAPWPDVIEDDDEGFDAEVGGESPSDVEFGGGLTPQRRKGTAAADDPDTPDPREAPGDGEDGTAEAVEDAELIDDTELNEQSEVTAEAPVDPATAEAEGGDEAEPEDDAIDELMEKTAERPDGTEPMADTGIARPDSSGGRRAGGDRSRPGTRRPEPLGELDSPVTEYHCPECGYTEQSATSSLRAGDICPECRRGYLGEREQ